MRINSNNDHFYKEQQKTDEHKETNRIWLSLKNEEYFSQLLIGFLDDATDNEDRLFDGVRLESENSISFNSILNDKPFGILGKSYMKKEETIQLGISTTTVGAFEISISNMEGLLKSSDIILIDQVLNINHNLNKSPYAFSISSPVINNTRFKLFITNSLANSSAYNIKRANLKVYSSIYALNIDSNTTIKTVNIYNILGQLIYKGNNRKKFSLYKNQLGANRILILKIQLHTGEIITKKVIHST